jgi:hypothetical protein
VRGRRGIALGEYGPKSPLQRLVENQTARPDVRAVRIRFACFSTIITATAMPSRSAFFEARLAV